MAYKLIRVEMIGEPGMGENYDKSQEAQRDMD
jgi:hypothetical protein